LQNHRGCHDATLNGRSARSPAARAATANHGAINTTVLGRDAIGITGRAADNAAGGANNTAAFDGGDAVSGRAIDNAAKPSNTAGRDCWRAVSAAAHALNFAVGGSNGRDPISPVTAADARRSRYVRRQPTAGPRSAPSPGLLPRACGRDLRAADPRSHPPLPA
jgi:hypothetical protein